MIFIYKNFEELLKKFDEINSKDWLIVPRHGYGENGLFFEELLGIERNDLSIPDYYDIELKVQSKYSSFPITLFSHTLDGPEPMALQAFVSRYGARDYVYNDAKVIYLKLNALSFTSWGKTLKMKLHCDNKKKRLYIHVAHSNGKTIELKSYWEYNSLYTTIKRKANNLCIVENETRTICSIKQIRYTNISFFKLSSYERFIEGLKSGKIFIQIKYGIYKNGPRAGRPYNHGIAFQIYASDLNCIYDKVLLQKK